MFEEKGFRSRITGAIMGSYTGKQVMLVGHLVSQAEGNNLKIQCTDGPIILAQLQQPLNGFVAPGALLELEGVPQNRNVLKVLNCAQVPSHLAENFDKEMYNEMVKLVVPAYDQNSVIINSVNEHFGGSNEQEINVLKTRSDTAAQEQAYL